MESGDLVHKITIQKPNPASPKDAAGQRITQWLDVKTSIWARVEPLTGRAEFIAAQTQASTTHRITIRYSPQVAGIDATHRVVFRGRTFMLDRPPINLDEANEWLVLQCTEGLRVTS